MPPGGSISMRDTAMLIKFKSRLLRLWRKRFIEPAVRPLPKPADTLLDEYGAHCIDDMVPWLFLDIPYAGSEQADHRLRSTTNETPDWRLPLGFPINDSQNSKAKPQVSISAADVRLGEVPVRDGKAATIYVYWDEESKVGYEFDSVSEIDEVIQKIRTNYRNKAKREAARLLAVKKRLTD